MSNSRNVCEANLATLVYARSTVVRTRTQDLEPPAHGPDTFGIGFAFNHNGYVSLAANVRHTRTVVDDGHGNVIRRVDSTY